MRGAGREIPKGRGHGAQSAMAASDAELQPARAANCSAHGCGLEMAAAAAVSAAAALRRVHSGQPMYSRKQRGTMRELEDSYRPSCHNAAYERGSYGLRASAANPRDSSVNAVVVGQPDENGDAAAPGGWGSVQAASAQEAQGGLHRVVLGYGSASTNRLLGGRTPVSPIAEGPPARPPVPKSDTWTTGAAHQDFDHRRTRCAWENTPEMN